MNFKNYYVQRGNGKPIILLHGNGDNLRYFKKQIEYFSKKFKVFALDTRGHGKSKRGTAPFTIRQFAEDLYEFMNKEGIVKADILGFSDGGNIALVFAINHPDRVNNLILNGANFHPKGIKNIAQLPTVIGYKICSHLNKNYGVLKNRKEMLGLMINDPNLTVEDLSKVKARTLVIAGTYDVIRTSHTKLISKCIKGAKLALITGDHFIARKRHNIFNKIVDKFLNSDIPDVITV